MLAPVNVLLLYPRFPDTFWSFKHALPFIRKRAFLPPLGLLTVAAMLPREWDKRLVDTNVRPLTDADLAWADLVFLGAIIAQGSSARELIARCRAAGKTIVAGGPLFSMEHEHFPEVDHFVLDEAEATLPSFLRDYEAGSAQRTYRAAAFPDVRQSPAPVWELADLRQYASMSIQFSRGCPFDCEFCSVTAMLGHRPRAKTPAQIVGELDVLYRLGWRGPVFFVDDNLIGKQGLLKEGLLPALIAWQKGKRRLRFYTEASINLADDQELMRLMVEAGFDTVFIGIETPDEAGLVECSKHHNRDRDLIGDVKRLQRAGLQVQGGFIVGFDSDTPAIFRRQWEFIQKSGIATAMVGLLNAPRGTRLYSRLEREGRLTGQTTGDNVDGSTNFIPRMDAGALREGYANLLHRLYAPGPYYRRVRALLREYRPRRAPGSFRWSDLVTFAHSSLRLGIFGRECVHYWGLLAWTILRRPALLHVAVTCAIYGHHFRRTCEAIGL
jgi:radical SAM superfamily enzyme YgiQ (UPF0313 family)